MANSDATAARTDETEVRFRLRSVFIATIVVAIAAAVLGAFVRSFPAEVRLRLSIYWGVLAALLAVVFVVNATKRYRAEKLAGTTLFVLLPHSYFLPRTPRFMSILFGFLLLLAAPAIWCVGSFIIAEKSINVLPWMHWWNSCYAVIASGTGITYLWWNRKVRVCENGVLVRHAMQPWSECQRFYWDACTPDVIVTEWGGAHTRQRRVAARVPDVDRSAVEAVFREKTKK